MVALMALMALCLRGVQWGGGWWHTQAAFPSATAPK